MDGYTIRLATYDDLIRLRGWLKQEHNDRIEGSFFCNYNLIEAGYHTGSLTVLIRDSDSLPVAFVLGDDNIDILAVKAGCRGNKLGKHLAMHFINSARQRDIIGLYGECAPCTSKPFWKKIGFVSVPSPYGDSNNCWIAYPLPHDNEIPENSPHKTIAIAIEDDNYQILPRFQSDAIVVDNRLILAHDFVEYIPDSNKQLEIYVNDKVLFADKIKCVSNVGGEHNCPWVRIRKLFER